MTDKQRIKQLEGELKELRLEMCVLSPEQIHAIFTEAVSAVVEGCRESLGYLEACATEYVLQMDKAEKLAAISDDPVCQRDLLGFNPETGKVWTEDPLTGENLRRADG